MGIIGHEIWRVNAWDDVQFVQKKVSKAWLLALEVHSQLVDTRENLKSHICQLAMLILENSEPED